MIHDDAGCQWDRKKWYKGKDKLRITPITFINLLYTPYIIRAIAICPRIEGGTTDSAFGDALYRG